jgi:uncharacterized membrane protein YeaQ/YmgE (transglycosylase-associated protein family)
VEERMEGLLETLGIIGLLILAVIGVLSGLLASFVTGGNRGTYIVVGVLAAIAAPFLLALVGLGVVAAYGVAALLIASVIGAAIVLLIVGLISGDRGH